MIPVISILFGLSAALMIWSFWERVPGWFLAWHSGPWTRVAVRLQKASASGSLKQVGWLATGGIVVAGAATVWLSASPWLFLPGCAAGAFVPWMAAGVLEGRREKAFAGQLPDTLEMMASSLRAGQSLPQAVALAGMECPEPSLSIWKSVGQELNLGAVPETALESLARRFHGREVEKDLTLLSSAVGVNRSTGGNLAETLVRLCETMRERVRLRAQVEALTAQGKLSGWVVGLLPLVLLAALQWLDPELMRPMFTTSTGWMMLGAGAGMELVGAWFIRRIVSIQA
jgi:tight adherence protein B